MKSSFPTWLAKINAKKKSAMLIASILNLREIPPPNSSILKFGGEKGYIHIHKYKSNERINEPKKTGARICGQNPLVRPNSTFPASIFLGFSVLHNLLA